jgi:hypothetical protein
LFLVDADEVVDGQPIGQRGGGLLNGARPDPAELCARRCNPGAALVAAHA